MDWNLDNIVTTAFLIQFLPKFLLYTLNIKQMHKMEEHPGILPIGLKFQMAPKLKTQRIAHFGKN